MVDEIPIDGNGKSVQGTDVACASVAVPTTEEMSRQYSKEIRDQSEEILALVTNRGDHGDGIQARETHFGHDTDVDEITAKQQRQAVLTSSNESPAKKSLQSLDDTEFSLVHTSKEESTKEGQAVDTPWKDEQSSNVPSRSCVSDETDSKCIERVDTTNLGRSQARQLLQPGAYRIIPLEGRVDSSDNVTVQEHNSSPELSAAEPLSSRTEPLATSDQHAVQAVKVEPDVEEQRIRNEILNQAVQADVVVLANDDNGNNGDKLQRGTRCWIFRHKRMLLGIVIILIICLVVGLVGVSVASRKKNNGATSTNTTGVGEVSLSPQSPQRPTLEIVNERDKLNCGIPNFPIFYDYDDNGNRLGLDVDLCHALAAAILGDPQKVEFVPLQLSERFIGLTNGTVDVYARAAPTMERDLFETSSKVGVTFTIPYSYGGIVFGGIPDMVSCADSLSTMGEMCSSMQVCVGEGTTYQNWLERVLPKSHIVPLPASEILTAFLEGNCNVVVGVDWDLRRLLIVKQVLGPGYVTGQTALYYEGLSMVTRDDDAQWSDMVHMILQSLMVAEGQGITRATASSFMTTNLFGEKYTDIFRNAIAARGNYGELYDRYYESVIPRRGNATINLLNNGSTPLIRSPDLGTGVSNLGIGPVSGGLLERIIARGYLICGIHDIETGFAEYNPDTGLWRGLDVDFCRAVAASLFYGSTSFQDILSIVDLTDHESGYVSLATEEVDVLAGAVATLQNEVLEPSTLQGFSFSMPYFYHNLAETRALATGQSDPQWSSFTHWVVASTIYAETHGISKDTSNDMPEIGMFGGDYRRMFRDAILAVGNYGDIYDRNLLSVTPRSVLNQLNIEDGPQHRPIAFE